MRVDPDGRSDELFINGDESESAFALLQSSTSMILSRDSKTGKISAIGEALNEDDKKLLNVIKCNEISVNVEANSFNSINVNGVNYMTNGGAFMGNIIENSSFTSEIQIGIKPFESISLTFDISTVKAFQTINPYLLEDFDIFAGTKGKSILHEITEAYSGGLISKKSGISAQPAIKGNPTYWIYEKAHKADTTVPQPGDGVITQNDLLKIRLQKEKGDKK